MKKDKRWTLKTASQQHIQQLVNDLRIHRALCRTLAVRGVNDFDSAKNFFRPSLTQLHDPFLMKGMEKAVERITQAVEWHERILIYGDYDVDGTTAVAVAYSFLREYYEGELSYYIPNRYKEGYGISRQGIEFAHANGFTLMITLDCGIKSVELIRQAQSLGIDVIVCDHHTPDEILPPAFAILNPKQKDCPYPYKELSGCGIGFKLISALSKKWQLSDDTVFCYLDLVATSIAADIVPIDGENRILAFYGIEKINKDPCPSIKKIRETAGIDRELLLSDLVFVIGPRVNAAGRMDDARKAVDLFISKDENEIGYLARQLHNDNADRKEVDRNITEEALALIQNNEALQERKSTVLYKEDWHKGVVGIVASRLIDYFYRPTIILTRSNGRVSGSARSVRGFNIYEALHECRDLLENYGGHFYAAGMTLTPERVEDFVEKFEQVVARTIAPELLIPEIEIDAEIKLADIRQPFYNIIRQFEPFGPNNLRPVFLTRNVYDYNGYSKLVKDEHIRFVIHQHGGKIVDGIGFFLKDKADIVCSSRPFDLVYSIDESSFNGTAKLQIRVLDVRPSGS